MRATLAFNGLTFTDEHTRQTKKKEAGVKYKNDICVGLCLKLLFESDWYFCNITLSGWFLKLLTRNEVSNNHFL